jgi:hypothetical protein
MIGVLIVDYANRRNFEVLVDAKGKRVQVVDLHTTGDDIVLWVVIRAHHEPRINGEEATFLPYHYEELSIVPWSFTDLRHCGRKRKD